MGKLSLLEESLELPSTGSNLTLEETRGGSLLEFMLVFAKKSSVFPSCSFFSVLLGLVYNINFFTRSPGADTAFGTLYTVLSFNLGDIYILVLRISSFLLGIEAAVTNGLIGL